MSPEPIESPRNPGARFQAPFAAAALWCALTAIVAAISASVYFSTGTQGFAELIEEGPFSDLRLTLYSVALCWMLAGVFIALLCFRRIHAGNGVTLACFFGVSLLYVNVLRERLGYGDIHDYIQAALNLHYGHPVHARYLYPPLWATLLQPLVPLGGRAMFDVCWLLNLLSLFAFYLLLQLTLQRYGFSSRLSALATFVFMVVNVPILRTLCYVQVNLHVTNLILMSLVVYPRSRFLSALALSLAVHLKASPIVLALAFLLARDVRWVAWFVLCTLSVAAGTVAINGLSPYRDFVSNVQFLLSEKRRPVFRENSIDSFLRASSEWLKIEHATTRGLITAGKLGLTAAVLALTVLCVKRRTFHEGDNRGNVLYNAAPPLLVLMTMTAPLVWEHHPVFLALPYLVLLRDLDSARDWLWFGLAYFLEFLLPTFDFFPWSYGRLASPFIWLALAWSLSHKPCPSTLFMRANRWLTTAALAPDGR